MPYVKGLAADNSDVTENTAVRMVSGGGGGLILDQQAHYQFVKVHVAPDRITCGNVSCNHWYSNARYGSAAKTAKASK